MLWALNSGRKNRMRNGSGLNPLLLILLIKVTFSRKNSFSYWFCKMFALLLLRLHIFDLLKITMTNVHHLPKSRRQLQSWLWIDIFTYFFHFIYFWGFFSILHIKSKKSLFLKYFIDFSCFLSCKMRILNDFFIILRL